MTFTLNDIVYHIKYTHVAIYVTTKILKTVLRKLTISVCPCLEAEAQ